MVAASRTSSTRAPSVSNDSCSNPRKGINDPADIKEHVAIQIMANTASTAAQACFVFASDDLFYGITVNSGNAIFTLLASQLIGYGYAGLFRGMLVYPTVRVVSQVVCRV
jgi:hypothetical protein